MPISTAGEDRRAHVEEIERGEFAAEVEIRFEEIADRSDVFPVALENVGVNFVRLDRPGDDVLTEVSEIVVE